MSINPHFAPLNEDTLGHKLSRVCSPEAPERLRGAFAKGMAPGFSPEELLTGLYQLSVRYHELAETIRETISGLPENLLNTALRAPLPGPVLHFLTEFSLEEEQIELLLTNKATPNEAFTALAGKVGQRLTVIIADNQRRLLEHPPIIEALYMNKATPMSVATKIIELAARHKLDLSLEAYHEMVKALDLDPPTEEDPIDAELQAAALDHQFNHAGTIQLATISDDEEDEEDEEETKKRVIISQLPVSARIRLAQLGNRFHRAQLIRDSNKVVSMAAIKSPSITDTEVDEYSKNRQISEDVIRYISKRKDWLKSYRIKVNLVFNPKTPLTVAMSLLNFLRKNDLRALARSRNVPQVLRTTATQRLRNAR